MTLSALIYLNIRENHFKLRSKYHIIFVDRKSNATPSNHVHMVYTVHCAMYVHDTMCVFERIFFSTSLTIALFSMFVLNCCFCTQCSSSSTQSFAVKAWITTLVNIAYTVHNSYCVHWLWLCGMQTYRVKE